MGIGLISYSLYLWHYPIFVFDRILYFSNDSFLKLFLIFVLIFTLSFLSYRFIEKPSRNQKNNFKIILSSILFTTSVVLIFLLIIISNNGFKKDSQQFLIINMMTCHLIYLKIQMVNLVLR